MQLVLDTVQNYHVPVVEFVDLLLADLAACLNGEIRLTSLDLVVRAAESTPCYMVVDFSRDDRLHFNDSNGIR